MSSSSSSTRALRGALVLALVLAAAGLAPAVRAQAPAEAAKAEAGKADSARAEVGKPLQAAQDLIRDHKFKDALAKVREAEAVPGRTPYENFIIDRMRGSAAAGAGDNDTAISSFEAVVASGRLAADDQSRVEAALAGLAYGKKDYARAASWAGRYLKESREGGDPKLHDQMQELMAQSLYLAGDYQAAAREVKELVEADEKAGRTPSEERLLILASSQVKNNDNAGYAATLERLVASYPKKQYWADLISRLQRRPGFSERLELDVLRLKLASGNLSAANDYMVLAQLALQAGYPIEARKVIEQGYAGGVLGKGAEAERQKRLQDLANRQAAEDLKTYAQGEAEALAAAGGDQLVNLGFVFVLAGQADKGLSLMEQGLKKGGLKRPEDARLHFGIACVFAGQKARAVQAFQSVHGSGDGTADLARLWALYAARAG